MYERSYANAIILHKGAESDLQGGLEIFLAYWRSSSPIGRLLGSLREG
jgi:hypothetical protein